jgi:formate-dependent nitrite reductase cytochrome c552 subunit
MNAMKALSGFPERTMGRIYAFSVDYREKRGHAYMLLDQTFTERQTVVKQPGAVPGREELFEV